MAAGDQIKAPSNQAKPREERVGTYIAWSRHAPHAEVWRKEGFREHHDQVPSGISIVMGAGALLDPKTGEKLFTWDPWKILKLVS